MGLVRACSQCSYWCSFTLISLMLVVSAALAFHDLALLRQQKLAIQQVINLPLHQLECVEVCRTWFTQKKGTQCCDRYNSDLCVGQKLCKDEYVATERVNLEIWLNDAYNEFWLAGTCVILLAIMKLSEMKQEVPVDAPQIRRCQRENSIKISDNLVEEKAKAQHDAFEDEKCHDIQTSKSSQSQSSAVAGVYLMKEHYQCILDFLKNHKCCLDELQSSRFLNQASPQHDQYQ